MFESELRSTVSLTSSSTCTILLNDLLRATVSWFFYLFGKSRRTVSRPVPHRLFRVL